MRSISTWLETRRVVRTVSAALPGNKEDVADEENARRWHHGCPFAQNGDLGTSRFKGQLPIAYTILACMVGQRLGRDHLRTISRPRASHRLLQRGDKAGPGLRETLQHAPS